MASSESLAAVEDCNAKESLTNAVENDDQMTAIRPPSGNEQQQSIDTEEAEKDHSNNVGMKRVRDEESPVVAVEAVVAVAAAAGAVTDEEEAVVVNEAPAPVSKRAKTGAENLEPKKHRKEEEEEEDSGKQGKDNDAGNYTEVQLGPKVFHSAVELFTYLYDFLHGWICNQDVNKYEFMVLSDLVARGAPDKVECGITAIQIRMHPTWHSRCFFVVHKDGTVDDFSYRKAADKLMPLPSSLYLSTGELDLDKLFPGHKQRNQHQQQGRGAHNRGRGNKGASGGFRGGRGRGGHKGRQ